MLIAVSLSAVKVMYVKAKQKQRKIIWFEKPKLVWWILFPLRIHAFIVEEFKTQFPSILLSKVI